ncbi:MAG: hypothetical protein QF752_08100, partial [Planctomycetota bacterium]|nr:hypothetical protein [Planctomycetota bacterium]
NRSKSSDLTATHLASDSREFSSQSDRNLIQTHKLDIALTPKKRRTLSQLNRFKSVTNRPQKRRNGSNVRSS